MVSVADVVAHRRLRLRPRVYADRDGEVRWVATSELTDPTPFLEGGEILLTTGLETAGWTDEWSPYVTRLVRRGVVALGFAVGLTHEQVPPPLVAACEAEGLNLLEVPRATTFVAISRTTATLLEERQQHEERRALEMQRRLTRAALRPGAGSGVLRELAELLAGSAGAVDASGKYVDGPYGRAEHRLGPALVAAELDRIRPQGLRASSTVSTEAATHLLLPLGLSGRASSYLVASAPGRLSGGQRTAVTTAVALASLGMESRREERETVRRVRRRAIELVVDGDHATAATVLALAAGPETAGVVLPAQVTIVRATGPAGPDDAPDDALTDVEDLGASHGDRVLAARVGQELRVLAATGEVDRVVEVVAATGLRVGVGSTVAVADAVHSHTAAGHALARATSHAPVVRWQELMDSGVMGLLDPHRAHAFATDFLGPLRSNPEVDRLVETLACFLRHHGSQGAVAAELGIHRNTVRNRLTRVEAAIGSLGDPQVRVEAWLALRLAARDQ